MTSFSLRQRQQRLEPGGAGQRGRETSPSTLFELICFQIMELKGTEQLLNIQYPLIQQRLFIFSMMVSGEKGKEKSLGAFHRLIFA
jgi:hypothetical protein